MKPWETWNGAALRPPGIKAIEAEHTEGQQRVDQGQTTAPRNIVKTCTLNEGIQPEESDQVPRPESRCADCAVEKPHQCQPAREAGHCIQGVGCAYSSPAEPGIEDDKDSYAKCMGEVLGR